MPLTSRFPSFLSIFFLSLSLVACFEKNKSGELESPSSQSPPQLPQKEQTTPQSPEEDQIISAYQLNEGSGGVIKHATSGSDNEIELISSVIAPLIYEENLQEPPTTGLVIRAQNNFPVNTGSIQPSNFNNILNNLALLEFGVQAESAKGENFVITPPSTLDVATLISAAAKGESATRIYTSLGWSTTDAIDLDGWKSTLNTHVDISTKVWGLIDYPFSEGYVDSILLQNNTEFLPIDFQINSDLVMEDFESWVPEVFTPVNSKVSSLIEEYSARTKVTFANRFSLSTDFEFIDLELTDGLWMDDSPHQEIVPMLKISGEFLTFESSQYKAIKIPFVSSSLSLSVVMPTKNSFSLVENNIRGIIDEFNNNAISQEVDFMLPQFDIGSENDLSAIIHNGNYSTSTTPWTFQDNFESDYSNVTLTDMLERRGLIGESAISLNQSGLTGDSIAVTKLVSSVPSTVSWVISPGTDNVGLCNTCGSVSPGVGFRQISVNEAPLLTTVVSTNVLEDCKTVFEPLGATQARPFIFVVRDELTGNILQIGRVVKLDGEIAQKEVCEGERSSFSDNIMPLRAGEADDHVEISKFVETTLTNQQLLSQRPDELNKLLLTYLSKETSDGNYLAPSMNQLMLSVLTNSANSEVLFRDWLNSIGSDILPSALLESIDVSNKMLSQSDSVLWVQSGYKYKSDFFEMLSAGFGANLKSSDFLFNASEQKLDIENWLSGIVPENFAFESMIGNRTRLFLASKTKSLLPISGDPVTGLFKKNDDSIVSMPMLRFSGKYPFYENTLLEAVEIPSETGSLLVVIPKNLEFESVQSDLDEQVEYIVDNLREHDIQFSIPLFSVENKMSKEDILRTHFFDNITSLKPLLPLPQYSKNSIYFDKQGVQNDAYSFTAFAAPAAAGSGTSYTLIITSGISTGYNAPFFTSRIWFGSTNRAAENVDSRPFFFFVRDKKTGLFQQIGKFMSVSRS